MSSLSGASQPPSSLSDTYRRARRVKLPNSASDPQSEQVIDKCAVQVRFEFEEFLETFKDRHSQLYYVRQLDIMESNESRLFILDWSHLIPDGLSYQNWDGDMAKMIQRDYYR